MSGVFLTCDPANLVIVDGFASCTEWVQRQVMFPMYELDPIDLATVMGATATFLTLCFASRALVRTILSAGASD